MHSMSLDPALDSTRAAPAAGVSPRLLGALFIAEAVLAFAPIAVLGPAIGWPASLRQPAATQLTAIAAQPDALALGYGLYLLYSILIAPVMIGLAARTLGGLGRPIAATVAAFAALSALARSIGILRWLTVMPALAQSHAGAANDSARAQIELVFSAITSYGGGIGELLGVSIFMALSLGLLCVQALRNGALPRWLAALGLVTALALASVATPSFGLALALPIAVGATLLSVWMLAAGIWLLRSR